MSKWNRAERTIVEPPPQPQNKYQGKETLHLDQPRREFKTLLTKQVSVDGDDPQQKQNELFLFETASNSKSLFNNGAIEGDQAVHD